MVLRKEKTYVDDLNAVITSNFSADAIDWSHQQQDAYRNTPFGDLVYWDPFGILVFNSNMP